MKDVFSVEGKVTIVTGGGTGIGESIAREFAGRGAAVLIASRNAQHLEPVRDSIRQSGGRCEMAVCDVRDPVACDAMVAEAVKHFGRIDVLINNHGANIPAPALGLSANAWKAVVGINLDGVFFCSKAAAQQFVAQNGGGSIINISSTASINASPMMNPYGASKAAVNNLTASQAAEWGALGIRVNCIAPGAIETEALGQRINKKMSEMIARSRALQRFGRVEEVAYTCIFLASEAASYITGALLVIDGGNSPRFG